MYGLQWKIERFLIQDGDDPEEWHAFVWPLDDSIEHVPTEFSCPCMPRYKITIGIHPPGEGVCLCEYHELIHNSLDGRELFE